MSERLPLIIEANELDTHLHDNNIVIVDLCKKETWLQSHIPGAVYLEYPRILHVVKPAMGLLPSAAELEQVLSSLGISNDTHVIAYDDEGGGKAARLLWTLDVIGHKDYSLLNGGLHAWANEGHPLESDIRPVTPAQYSISEFGMASIDLDYIIAHLEDKNLRLLDSRSPEEYAGTKKFAERGGHIPHAVNMDWMLTMDKYNNLRFLPDDEIHAMLTERDIHPSNEVILYCQTHHRSSHTYILLKHLGYENIKGYPGAWSEWGNRHDTPVEV